MSVSAIVLAAGNGDRFITSRGSKLLHPLLGQPILLRTLHSARDAGVAAATVVLGYEADRVRAVAERGCPSGMHLNFVYNPEWRLENGVSVLAARGRTNGAHFALLMGDHVFDPSVLRRLLNLTLRPDECALAVDARPTSAAVAAEATKVRREGARIVAIGKDLDDYDALDTGLFVCSPMLFTMLDRAREAGDTTLSGGIGRLAALGLMRAVEIGDAPWCDIDTPDDLDAAESVLSAAPTADKA